MAYGLYVTLDQTKWFRDDFSSEALMTGTVYTDINRTVAKDLTGFTINLNMARSTGPGRFVDFFNKEGTAVVEANGTWSYAVAEGDIPVRGLYYFSVTLTKAGVKETTLNTVEFQIVGGPSE